MYKRSKEILWDKYPKLYQGKKYLQCSLDFIKKLNEDLILLSHPCLHNSLISLITCINIYAWHRMVFRYIYYVFSPCLSLFLSRSFADRLAKLVIYIIDGKDEKYGQRMCLQEQSYFYFLYFPMWSLCNSCIFLVRSKWLKNNNLAAIYYKIIS